MIKLYLNSEMKKTKRLYLSNKNDIIQRYSDIIDIKNSQGYITYPVKIDYIRTIKNIFSVSGIIIITTIIFYIISKL